jgi:RNA-binding protein
MAERFSRRSFNQLQRLGRVLHLSPSRKLIARAEREAKIGAKVFDKELRLVGIIHDIFGPTSRPYLSIKPAVEDPNRYLRRVLYLKRERR